MNLTFIDNKYNSFLEDLKVRVSSSRHKAALSVNKELILLYHHIGSEILKCQKEHGWGAKVIDQLSKDLKSEFSEMKGFSPRNLKYMRKFAEEYPAIQFVQQVVAQLPWGHNVFLIELVQDKDQRLFYVNKAIQNGWLRDAMVKEIENKLYDREGKTISNFDHVLSSPQSDLAQMTLRSPYLFDFLSLGKDAHEREIENALVNHIEKFLLSLGDGFAFVGRQYRIQIAEQDYWIDLLFYHVRLKSYIVIELKSGKFKPEYAGKLNFYLSAVDDLLRDDLDNPTIGLILCSSKAGVTAEYAFRDINKPMGLAEYNLTAAIPEQIKTRLPSIEELEAELSKHP
jgi:predicted nuclease of restriction endonuclease-like (RecB) superfamily